MSEPRPLRVGIVGFGWMGQVHARAYARLRQHYPDAPLAPELVAVADNAADTRLADAVAAYGFGDGARRLARAGRPRRPRPGQRHRPQLRPPRRRGGGRAGRQAPLGREARRPGRRRDPGDPRRRTRGRSAVGRRLQLPQRAGGGTGPAADRRRPAGRGRARHHPAALRLRRPSRRRADLAVQNDGPDRVCSATWSATASTWVATSSARSPSWSPTGPPSSTPGRWSMRRRTARPGSPAARGVRWRTRTTSRCCSASPAAPGACWSPAGWRSASSAATASRCTASAARWPGTSGGWASCGSRSTRTSPTPRTPRCSAGPGDGELGAFQPGSGIAMGFDDLKVVELHRLVRSIATGQPVGATIDDAVRAAELVEAIADSADRRPGSRLIRHRLPKLPTDCSNRTDFLSFVGSFSKDWADADEHRGRCLVRGAGAPDGRGDAAGPAADPPGRSPGHRVDQVADADVRLPRQHRQLQSGEEDGESAVPPRGGDPR